MKYAEDTLKSLIFRKTESVGNKAEDFNPTALEFNFTRIIDEFKIIMILIINHKTSTTLSYRKILEALVPKLIQGVHKVRVVLDVSIFN